MKRVSVVILNWNGVDMLRKFIPSVMDNSVGEGIEICVADNASSDGSLEMLRSEFPVVRLIELDQNYGFAEGYNRALEQVDAEYVVLLNSDVEVTPHWLEPLLDYMDTHSGTVACQPKLLSWHNKEYFEYAGASGGFIDRYGYPFCRGRIFDVVEKDCGQYDTVTEVMWVTGAALFIRLADYREVGGLDGHFFAHMEEIDLCWRLRSRGKKLVCIPQSVVYHVHLYLVVFLRFDRRFVGTGSQRNQTLAYRYGDLTDCRRLYRLCHYRDVAGRDSQYVVVYHLIRRHSYLCHDFTGHIRGIHFTTDGEILLYPRSCQQPEHRGDVVIHRRSGCRYHQFFPFVILASKKTSYSDSRYPNGIHGRISE